MTLVDIYPCCEQPTGQPMLGGHRHICFNAWGKCSECGDDCLCDLWDESTHICGECDAS